MSSSGDRRYHNVYPKRKQDWVVKPVLEKKTKPHVAEMLYELGWCDWMGQHRGSIHYKPSVPWPNLSPKDRRTAYDCTTHIHGLAYYPPSLYHLAHELKTDAQHLYEQHKTTERSLVAYKWSLIQRQWLTSWGMPHIDLEPLGCPKFNDLPRLSSVASCGQHKHPLQLHCPQVKCYHFVQWMRGQRGLDHDTRYIHHERTQRFLAAQKPGTSLRCPPNHTIDTFNFVPNACKTRIVVLINRCFI